MITLSSCYLATHNPYKQEEFQRLLSLLQPKAKGKWHYPSTPLAVDEPGMSYYENAYLKAKAYFEHFGHAAMADDSGLEIEALPNELGVNTAYFGGSSCSNDEDRCNLIMHRMLSVKNRQATFYCILCFYCSPQEVFFFTGRMKGRIADKISLTKGMAQDPIFIPEKEDKPVSELGPQWKDRHSHRAKAMERAMRLIHFS